MIRKTATSYTEKTLRRCDEDVTVAVRIRYRPSPCPASADRCKYFASRTSASELACSSANSRAWRNVRTPTCRGSDVFKIALPSAEKKRKTLPACRKGCAHLSGSRSPQTLTEGRTHFPPHFRIRLQLARRKRRKEVGQALGRGCARTSRSSAPSYTSFVAAPRNPGQVYRLGSVRTSKNLGGHSGFL